MQRFFTSLYEFARILEKLKIFIGLDFVACEFRVV